MNIVSLDLEENGTQNYLKLAKQILRGQGQNPRQETLVRDYGCNKRVSGALDG